MIRNLVLALCLLAPSFAAPRGRQLWSRGEGRVIGGSNADISNYPWQLAFLYSGSQICGASIISGNWALTAAHCVDGKSVSLMSVRGGSTYKNSGGTVLNVASGYMHKQYNSATVDYDIAVLQVSGSLSGSNMRAVGLPNDNYDPPGGLAVTATGWGQTSTSGGAPNNLLKVDMSIIDRATCQNIFANVNTVTARMVCAGQAGKSVCMGDSGGPLVSGSTQVGIVSWTGSSCEATGAAYANVGNLRSWIRDATGV
ncbi:trypsin alpha-3-like [Schistocerca nitens]|uniref:trypsin alpha-3-like n=1 Tax=Schistocerca nitens TaxID=7011 RepID=UPI00211891AA|nr:trypsin alpha-3-like [Schistocerca nitens]